MDVGDHDSDALPLPDYAADADAGGHSFVRRAPSGAPQDAMRVLDAHDRLTRYAPRHAHDPGSGSSDHGAERSGEVDPAMTGNAGASIAFHPASPASGASAIMAPRLARMTDA